MEKNLSSRIVLHQVPRKYYQPDDVLELSGISRFEKVKTEIFDTAIVGGEKIACEIADLIRKKQANNEICVLGLNSGRSPIEMY